MNRSLKIPLCLSILTAVCFAVAPAPTFAQTYYLSAAGDDASDGLSEAAPWRSIDRLNDESLPDGATVLLRRGDVFRGAVSSKGFRTGLTFGAYGEGDAPVISGSLKIRGWTPTTHPDLASEVYEADVSGLPLTGAGIHHLFVDGDLMTIARYPNVDSPAGKNWLKVGAASEPDGFTDPALAAYGKPDGYWTGATLRIRDYSWTYTVLEITGYRASDGRIEAGPLTTPEGDKIQNGLGRQLPEWGYYLDGKLSELDSPGEWFYDAAAGKVYLYPPDGATDPDDLLVEGSTYDTGLNIYWQEHDTTVEDLAFRHFIGKGVNINSSARCVVRNCDIAFCTVGLYAWNAPDLLVSGSRFDDNLKQAIVVNAQTDFDMGAAACENNVIRNTAMFSGYGQRYHGVYQGLGISAFGRALTIRGNWIENTSHAGIDLKSAGYHIVENNVVKNSLLLLNDGGAIVIGSDGNVIRSNFLLDSLGNTDASNGCASDKIPCSHHSPYGMGVGANSGYRDNVIENNTIANNTDMGIRLNSFVDTTVRNNVVYNCDPQIAIEDKHGASSGNVVEGNILYSLDPDQRGLSLTNMTEHGTFDDNVYANPYGEVVIIRDGRHYSLGQWQAAFPGYDANSRAFHPDLPQYETKAIGEEQVRNPTFDADIADWTGSGAADILFDPGKPELDGGSLKAVYAGENNANVIPNTLSIEKDQWYRLAFSTIADGYGNIQLRVNRTAPEWEILEERYFALDASRKECVFVFKAKENTDACKILFITKAYDAGTYWLDNVSFTAVDAVENDARRQSRLFMNPTGETATVGLGCAEYETLDGRTATDAIALAPYSSKILIHTGDRCGLMKCIAILKLLAGAAPDADLTLLADDLDQNGRLGLGDCILMLKMAAGR